MGKEGGWEGGSPSPVRVRALRRLGAALSAVRGSRRSRVSRGKPDSTRLVPGASFPSLLADDARCLARAVCAPNPSALGTQLDARHLGQGAAPVLKAGRGARRGRSRRSSGLRRRAWRRGVAPAMLLLRLRQALGFRGGELPRRVRRGDCRVQYALVAVAHGWLGSWLVAVAPRGHGHRRRPGPHEHRFRHIRRSLRLGERRCLDPLIRSSEHCWHRIVPCRQ